MAETVSKVFHLFPLLPKELRDAIWRQCLPHRIVELDHPRNDIALEVATLEERKLPLCGFAHTTRLNSQPPVIARVCHEARAVALETGHRLSDPGEGQGDEGKGGPGKPRYPEYTLYNARFGQWCDAHRDTVHLHYDPTFLIDFGLTIPANPLPYLVDTARRAAGGASATLDLVRSDAELGNGLAALRDLSVCVQVVCLHVGLAPAVASGLFDVDQRIALVGAWDHGLIAEFRRLHAEHGSRQDFRTAEFFNRYTDDEASITRDCRTSLTQLMADLDTGWLRDRWEAESEAAHANYPEEDEEEEVWIHTASSGVGVDDEEDPTPAQCQRQNPNHPWVQAALLHKPTFHPTVMMRLCVKPCYAGLSAMPCQDDTGRWRNA